MMNKFIKIFNNTYFIIKDALVYDLDINNICQGVQKMVPKSIVKNLDVIYIGNFDDLIDREMTAAYSDGCIYVLNTHQSESEMIDDIVHELAHSVEDFFGMELYGDVKLENEFLQKRKMLCHLLKHNNIKFPTNLYGEVDYSENLDKFLYIDLGYNTLTSYIHDIFPSPYSVTSLREYWAICFENYHTGKINIKQMCPEAYTKITELYKKCGK